MFLKILQFLQFLFSAKKVIPAAADPVEPIEETVEIEEEKLDKMKSEERQRGTAKAKDSLFATFNLEKGE